MSRRVRWQGRTGWYKSLIVTGFVIGLVFWLYRSIFPSDRAKIEAMLAAIVEIGSFQESAHPFEALSEAKELMAHLALPIEIRIQEDGMAVRVYSLEAPRIREGFAALRQELQELAITVKELSITVDTDRAEVVFAGQAIGRDRGRSDFFLEQGQVTLSLRRRDDVWLIAAGEISR